MRESNSLAFQCSDCDATYSRREHLKRHQRSHTQGRPYQCVVCQKRFSRRDVLNRHAHLHDNSASGDTTQTRIIGSRVGRACTECSAKKVRCDGNLPCVSCVSKDKADICVYPGGHTPQSSLQGDLSLRELAASHTLIDLQDNRLCQVMDENFNHVAGLLSSEDFMLRQEQSNNRSYVMPEESSLINGNQLTTSNIDPPEAVADNEMRVDFAEDPDFQQTFALDLPFYPCTYDLGIADSAMDWLNLPDYAIAIDGTMTPAYRQSRVQTRQGTRQGTPTGDGSQLSGEDAMQEGESSWPTDWRPTTHTELGLPAVTLTPTQYDEGNTMQVKCLTREARDSLYSFLEDIARYSPTSLDIRAFPDVKVTNVLIQLYFEHFHPLWPVFHKATFDVSNTSSVVLLAILTIGCRYQTPGLALGFSELLRRAIQASCERDNTLVRSLGVNQALLISQVSGIFQGNKRTLEISESMRGHLVTHTRRSRFIDNRASRELFVPSPASTSTVGHDNLEQRWHDWRCKEERKRIGLAAWISDCTFASNFNMLPMMSVSELQCPLPCDETLWDAPSAVAWKSRFLASRLPPEPASIQQSVNALLDGKTVHTNPWGRCILLLCLYRVTWQESHYRNDNNTARRDQVCLAFDLVNASSVQFPISQQGDLFYHLLQLELHAPMMNLHSLAGRRTLIEGDIAAQQVQKWATRNATSARKAVYHAACIYHNLVNTPLNSTDEPIAAFNSAVVIWAYVKFRVAGPESEHDDFLISAHVPPNSDFMQRGGKVVIQGIGNASDKLKQVLHIFVTCLSNMTVWLISHSYAQILGQLADLQFDGTLGPEPIRM